MRTIVCHEPNRIGMVSKSDPVPGVREVLIRIRRVGLCGTDFHIYTGRHPYIDYPRVMGHELSGEVVALGEGASLRIGQRVTINPYLSCGECIACRKGRPNACVRVNVLGVHSDGGMCDLLVVPESAAIDAEGLTLDQAAMVEFLAIGAHAMARAPAGVAGRMLVVGAGPIGIATALFGRRDNLDVTLVDRRHARLEFARERLGFDGVLAQEDLETVLGARTAGEMFDLVVDATGSLSAMRRSLNFVAHGGALILVGVSPGDLSFEDPEFHKREATLIASRNALASDFKNVIAAIKSGEIPTELLHTHTLEADEVPMRLPELIPGTGSALKVVIRFSDPVSCEI